ncbi:MAG TPA: hypothetical protein VFV34_23645, partial [Blastocatellia bacterium]|nr:hypothetical protein [Blastocatellia bacterium]
GTVVAVTILGMAAHAIASAQVLDSGTITLQGTVSGYVEVRAGGPATISGNSGGGITNNKVKGDRFNSPTTLTIDFGDVGPANTSTWVTATVPIRLRSNLSYTLKASASSMSYGSGTPDADSVTLADIGFGVTAATRDSAGGIIAGTDTIAASANGDPTSGGNGSINAAGRYTFNANHSLNNYTTSTTIVTGPRINHAMVPTANTNGLVITTMFAIKPQFFTVGSFSTSVTFTVSNP